MAQERPAPHIVGSAFIMKYYLCLCEAPHELKGFYDDSSSLTRPGANGAMTTVTTKQGINDVLISFDKVYQVEILRADSQYSHLGAVMVLVTGFLIGESGIKRKFSHAFYLAPPGSGPYFVVNDIFSYVDDPESTIRVKHNHESKPVADDITNDEAHAADPVLDAETTQVADHSADNLTSAPQKNVNNNDKTNHQSENVAKSIAGKDVKIADPKSISTPNGVAQVAEESSPVVKQDASKKSYASMVNALKENPNPFEVKYVRKVVSKDPAKDQAKDKAPAPTTAKATAKATATDPSSKKPAKISYRSAKGHSVFVRYLPPDATPEQVAAIFKKFGSIKHRGVQVRSYKDQQFSFAFVEFVSLSSMESAIQASPITIGDDCYIAVQMKRQDNNNGGKFQNGNLQPHGGSEGRSYGKEGQVRGNGNGTSRVYQNGGAAPQTAKAQTN